MMNWLKFCGVLAIWAVLFWLFFATVGYAPKGPHCMRNDVACMPNVDSDGRRD